MTCIELNILTWILKETSIIVGVKQEKKYNRMHARVRRTAPAQTEVAAPFVADTLFLLAGIMSVSMEKKWFMWRNLLDIKLEL